LYNYLYNNEGAMTTTIDISRFRAALFELFDAVVGRDGDRVIVERRGVEGRAVLTSERHLTSLEQQVHALKQLLARLQAAPGRPEFRLVGSAELRVEPDQVLVTSRARQADALARKRAAL
jgi:hypothetical protein